MVDFPDNWPAQLNRYPEEQAVFLSEAMMALDWHRRLVPWLYRNESPDVLIQDTYTPNQMLESRWWLRHLDPDSPDYGKVPQAERDRLWEEVHSVYAGLDAILGEALKAAGPDAIVVLSSDHGVIPIRRQVRINNLLAREGLLRYSLDPQTGEPVVDWANTQAIHLKMIGIYMNPKGLAGNWLRGNGPEYEALRARVEKIVGGLRDEAGVAPLARRVRWEDAAVLREPKDRVADLILVMRPGYSLTEAMTADGAVFGDDLQSGYKQALVADDVPGLWTPFVVFGPGVKKGFRLTQPIRNADQAPTLLTLMGMKVPEQMQGRVVTEILEEP